MCTAFPERLDTYGRRRHPAPPLPLSQHKNSREWTWSIPDASRVNNIHKVVFVVTWDITLYVAAVCLNCMENLLLPCGPSLTLQRCVLGRKSVISSYEYVFFLFFFFFWGLSYVILVISSGRSKDSGRPCLSLWLTVLLAWIHVSDLLNNQITITFDTDKVYIYSLHILSVFSNNLKLKRKYNYNPKVELLHSQKKRCQHFFLAHNSKLNTKKTYFPSAYGKLFRSEIAF